MTETWLNEIPAIPLARSVPAVDPNAHPDEDARHVVCLSPREHITEGRYWLTADAYGSRYTTSERALRVDLDDPQGFGYALDQLYQLGRERKGREWLTGWTSLNYRARLGRTTDADRLALARALREVTGVRDD